MELVIIFFIVQTLLGVNAVHSIIYCSFHDLVAVEQKLNDKLEELRVISKQKSDILNELYLVKEKLNNANFAIKESQIMRSVSIEASNSIIDEYLKNKVK